MKAFFENDRFAMKAGVEIMEIGEGYATARMLVGPEHLNAVGVCQGGALFTLADLAFAAASNTQTETTVSLASNITFLRAVSGGYVYAEARRMADHHRVPFYEVRLTDEKDEIVAVLTASGYRKHKPQAGNGY